jgi:hypothetical protein
MHFVDQKSLDLSSRPGGDFHPSFETFSSWISNRSVAITVIGELELVSVMSELNSSNIFDGEEAAGTMDPVVLGMTF